MRCLLRLLLLCYCIRPCCGRHKRPTTTGAWVVPNGFRAYHLDSPLASSIATLLGRGRRSNLTVVDLGAGKGLYVRFLGTVGLRNVTGYEGVHNIEDMTSGRIQQREFTKPFGPCVRFDVFVCLGVAEHIPRDHEETFLRNVNCSAGDGLILSWAPPGQSGTGHVNLRSRADVIARLGALGFAVDAAASRFLGDQATLHWFKRNMLALRRRGQPSPFALDAPAVVEARGSVTTSDQSTAEEPTASSIVAALNKMRAGYAKLEARLDELHLRSTDVLLRSAMDEQLKGLNMLARVAPRIAAQST